MSIIIMIILMVWDNVFFGNPISISEGQGFGLMLVGALELGIEWGVLCGIGQLIRWYLKHG